jgi:hypothetical protein
MKNQTSQGWRLLSAALLATIVLLLLGAFSMSLAQTDKEQAKGSLAADIIGTWKGKRGDDAITLTFNKDKSFSLKESESAPTITDRYAISEPDTVELEAPNHLGMKVKIKVAADTMRITDSGGHSFELKRVK